MTEPAEFQRSRPRETQLHHIEVEDLGNDILRAGLASWQTVCLGRRFPARDDLELRNIASALPHAALIKVLDEGRDYECSVVGDAVIRAYNLPLKKQKVSDLERDAPSFGQRARMLFDQVLLAGHPIAARRIAGHDFPEARFSCAEAVLLPLGPEQTKIDHILAFAAFGSSFA